MRNSVKFQEISTAAFFDWGKTRMEFKNVLPHKGVNGCIQNSTTDRNFCSPKNNHDLATTHMALNF